MSAIVLDPHAARAVFDSACAMAWADGDLVEPELRSIRGLAVALGLSEALDATNEAIAQRTILPTAWRIARMDGRSRVLLLSAAAFIAISDGTLHPREEDMLDELRERALLEPGPARFALAHAAWVASSTTTDWPHRAASLLLVEGARRATLLAAHRAAA